MNDAIKVEKPELIHHATHYGGDIVYEAIKVIEAWDLGFHLGNAVKYIARAGKKEGSSREYDLNKARWYIDRYIEQAKGGPAHNDIAFIEKLYKEAKEDDLS